MKNLQSLKGLALFSALLLSSCAAERQTERQYDFDDNRFAKSNLLSTNQWKYKATVIETSQEGGFTIVGAATPLRIGRFEFTKDKLRFLHNLTPYADGGAGVSSDLINAWNIEHSEYRLREVNGKVTNVEEENNKISWREKQFFKMAWTSQAIDELTSFNSCFTKVHEELVDGSQEVGPEHFTFTVEKTYELNAACNSYGNIRRRQNAGNYTYTIQVKHSFAPMEESDYEPFVYRDEFDDRRTKYGFFETIVDRMDETTGRFEKETLVNRWHPEKEHTFYFAEDFPEDYKWIYNHPEIGIATVTNRVFEENGLNIRFHFESDPNVKFGDVRYSFVKFVEKEDDAAPFGYGPSDTNPLTGEIIKADSVIWTSALKHYVERIRDIQVGDEVRGSGPLFTRMTDVLRRTGVAESQDQWLETAESFNYRNDIRDAQGFDLLDPEEQVQRERSRSELQKILAANVYMNPAFSRSTFHDPFERLDGSNSLDMSYASSASYGADVISSAFDLMAKANVRMPEQARQYLDVTRKHVQQHQQNFGEVHISNWRPVKDPTTVYPLEQQLAVVRPMMDAGKSDQDIIDTILFRVALHELGHNLNLRHNFYGAVDFSNFSAPEPQRDRNNDIVTRDGKELMTRPVSSSVMDYLALADEYSAAHEWESYDRAALVYAYSGGTIDLAAVEAQQTEDGVRHVKRDRPQPFLYCTDEHRAWNNPFCNIFVVGTTPSEVVLSMIQNYDRAYEVRNHRYGRSYWDTRSYPSAVAGDMINPVKMLKLYSESNFFLKDMTELSTFTEEGRIADYRRIRQEFQDDARRAAALLASFYSGVIQLSSTERNIINNIDHFTGNVTRIGILYDKLFAMTALAGNFPMSIANDQPFDEVNFLKFINEEGELGAVLRDVLLDIAVDNIELVVRGFESFGRSLFANTSTVNPSMMNTNYIDRMKIQCYTKAGLRQAFGIDPDNFYPYFKGHPQLLPLFDDEVEPFLQSLNAAVVKVGGVDEPLVGQGHYPVYLSNDLSPTEVNDIVIVRVGDHFYTARRLGERAGYAYEFMRRGVNLSDNLVSTTMQQYVIQSKLFYDYSRFGREEPCITYQDVR